MHAILITGAASGIGAGIATELARMGSHVIVTDRKLEDVEPVASTIRESGGSVEAVALDVTSEESVTEALGRLSRPVDVLVNNAGLQLVAPLEEFPMPSWELLVQVMLIGVARVTRAVLPGMRTRGLGRIGNMGSNQSVGASPKQSAYE